MNKLKITFIFLLAFGQGFAQHTMSLQDCIETLVKNNLPYRDSQLQTELADAQLRQTQSQKMPSLGAGIGQNLNFGRSIDRFTNGYIDQVYSTNFVGINAQIPLFQGFQLQHQIKQSETLRQATEQNRAAILNQQTIRLMQAYVLVQTTAALQTAAAAQVSGTQSQVERLEKQVAAGTIGLNALYEIKAQLANDQFDEVTARTTYQQARLTLFQVMNLEVDDAIVFQTLDYNTQNFNVPTASTLYGQLENTLPEVRAGALRLSSFDSQIRATKASNLPSLSLSGNYGAFYTSTNPDESNYFKQLDATRNGGLSLNLNVPILNRWFSGPRVQVAKVQQRLAKNQLDITKQQLRQALEQVTQQRAAAAERYVAAQQQVASLKLSFAAAESRFTAGTASIFEYTLSKANLTRAEANAIRAKYELILQNKLIDFYRNIN
jgi:outer membrane protein